MHIRIVSSLVFLIAPVVVLGDSFLVKDAVLISGQSATPIADSWVRFSDGKITEVGTGPVEPAGDEIIEAEGRYLIPGLIDSHVHLYHATGLKRKYSDDFDSLYEEYMTQQPRSFLYYGFTSVVELNADAQTNARFKSAPIRPRLFHCGQGVILDNGFMSLEIPHGELDTTFPGYLVDHYRGERSIDNRERQLHSPEAAVRHVIAQGGRCIKMYYEEALWWPGSAPDFELPTVEITRDVVESAHEHKLPVLMHATTPAGHRFALDAGVDILAHGMWEWPSQQYDATEPALEYLQVANDVADSTIWIQPTLTTIRNTASLFDREILEAASWSNVVPKPYLQYLRSDAQSQRSDFLARFASLVSQGATPEEIPGLIQNVLSRYKTLVASMIDNGAKLLFATDTAVGGFGWAAPPGLAGYWEIQEWAESGISPQDLFRALTTNNALALGIGSEVGSIEVGKNADMLLLTENPLDNVAAYDSIDLVIIDGQIIERNALSAMQLKR